MKTEYIILALILIIVIVFITHKRRVLIEPKKRVKIIKIKPKRERVEPVIPFEVDRRRFEI